MLSVVVNKKNQKNVMTDVNNKKRQTIERCDRCKLKKTIELCLFSGEKTFGLPSGETKH